MESEIPKKQNMKKKGSKGWEPAFTGACYSTTADPSKPGNVPCNGCSCVIRLMYIM